MKAIACLEVAFLICLFVAPVSADWFEEDPHKMHYPQPPDPNGWDIRYDDNTLIADDWRCSADGPVTDVHFWGSQQNDEVGVITNVHLRIYSDQPASGQEHSRPLAELWERTFTQGQFSVIDYGTGDQGWYDPQEGQHITSDHTKFYQ